jgi:hypothetical protein
MKFFLSGNLFEQVQGNAIQYIYGLDPSRHWKVEITQQRDERSLAQNNALFGVMYPPLMEFIGLRGRRESEELHEYFCGEYFGWHEYEIMGKRKARPRRTTTTDEAGKRDVLSTVAFMDFCEFVKQRAAEQGCVLPDPDPMYHLRDEHGS